MGGSSWNGSYVCLVGVTLLSDIHAEHGDLPASGEAHWQRVLADGPGNPRSTPAWGVDGHRLSAVLGAFLFPALA